MNSDDYDDPKLEAQWLAEQGAIVQRYLEGQGIQHRGVAPESDWFIAPYVSGGSSDRRELGDLLSRRAQIIEDWTRDDQMWG